MSGTITGHDGRTYEIVDAARAEEMRLELNALNRAEAALKGARRDLAGAEALEKYGHALNLEAARDRVVEAERLVDELRVARTITPATRLEIARRRVETATAHLEAARNDRERRQRRAVLTDRRDDLKRAEAERRDRRRAIRAGGNALEWGAAVLEAEAERVARAAGRAR